MEEGKWDFDLGKIVDWWSGLSVKLLVFRFTEVVSLELLGLDDLSIVKQVSPSGSSWTVGGEDIFSVEVVKRWLEWRDTFRHVIAKLWEHVAEGCSDVG
jgi:hypothetical protein